MGSGSPPRPQALRPRKQPRQARARVTRDAVIVAAERILGRDGVAALTTRRLADEAGVSVGSIYQYFPGKPAIIAGLIDHFMARYHEAFRAVLAAVKDLPIDQVAQAICRVFFDVARQHGRAHVPLNELMGALGMTGALERQLAVYVEDVARFLSARRDVVVGDFRATAFVIVHAFEGVARAVATSSGGVDEETVAGEVVRMLARYLRR